jgi:hypothetical protein
MLDKGCFPWVGYVPVAIDQAFDDPFGYGVRPGSILGEQALTAGLDVDQAYPGLVAVEQADDLVADSPAEVGGIPDKGLAGP